jgi:membrane protein YdbS with pleckstrin-like domain
MIPFIEEYPVLAAILVALLSWLASAWQLLGINQPLLSLCSTVMGILGVFANFGGAQHKGAVSIFGVCVVMVVFLLATAWTWLRWRQRREEEER